MKAKELKKKYLDFFKSQGHAIIESAPLIPEHDPTVLFTTAGMQPFVPFFLELEHPLGKRIANVQKCLRTDDIDEVGDSTHHTFFEMLGNWSFGDYFKEEAITMTFDFLTKTLNLPLSHLGASCFKGDKDAPKDEESAKVWRALGMPHKRIVFLGKKENWWGPAGESGPCGPCTEIYYWVGKTKPPKNFNPEDKRWVEIGNNVSIEYNKTKKGDFEPLKKKSIDFGGGVERITAVLQEKEDNYLSELFLPIIKEIEKITKQSYPKNQKAMRIIADHIRASVFILGDERGAVPSNLDQGYILRRFIRRAIRQLKVLGLEIPKIDLRPLAEKVIETYQEDHPILKEKKKFILEELKKEQERFKLTLEKGLNMFKKLYILSTVSKTREKKIGKKTISGDEAFLLFQSYGFPFELTKELAEEYGLKVDKTGFEKEFQKHQALSRVGAEKKFKGGLSDASEETIKMHTATHLLNEALRKVLKADIHQKGSNITPERLRFDFNFDRKLTEEEIKKVEEEVNKRIKEKLEVRREEMELQKAFASGARGEFGAKYPPKVSVYCIGKDCSKEICMGPHVKNTSELGHFRIIKEEAVAAGIRRIKAVLER